MDQKIPRYLILEMNFKLAKLANFSWIKSISPAEILALIVFVLYIVLPVPTPSSISPYVNSPLGLIVIFCITVALFVYTHPAVAILYIFVAYFLLSRSVTNKTGAGQTAYLQYTPSKSERKAEIQQQIKEAAPPNQDQVIGKTGLVQPRQPTLEEEVVNKMAPVGKSEPAMYTTTSFSPVATNVQGAAPV